MARKRIPAQLRALLPGRRRRTATGTAPGTIVSLPDASQTVVHGIAYGADGDFEETKIASAEQLTAFCKRRPTTWINVDGTADAAMIARVGEIYGLHPLALEDSVNVHQRPKVDDYDDYLFIVLRMPSMKDRLEFEQLGIFVGPGFVVSIQERPDGDCFDPVRQRLRQNKGKIRRAGADYLAYALVDAVLDNFFPILETYSNRIEDIERRVVDEPSSGAINEIHSVRHDLLAMRHVVWPTREAVGVLTRSDVDVITPETRVFLRDCYDHAVHLIDIVDSGRELASALIDVHLSSLSTRLNEVMKVLTLIATIFIPLSFVASLYGMNFDTARSHWNMPELEWAYGYPFALGIMAAISVTMLAYFWRKGWLGNGARRRRTSDRPPDSTR